jgi:hypothetical protein
MIAVLLPDVGGETARASEVEHGNAAQVQITCTNDRKDGDCRHAEYFDFARMQIPQSRKGFILQRTHFERYSTSGQAQTIRLIKQMPGALPLLSSEAGTVPTMYTLK